MVARLHAHDVTQRDLATRWVVSEAAVSNWIRAGSIYDPNRFEWLRSIEGILGEAVTTRFAERVRTPTGSQHRDILADPQWWDFLRTRQLSSPIDVVVAANALLARFGSSTLAPTDLVERQARRHVAFGLCRVATGPYGLSLDAVTLLARLAPLVTTELCHFMRATPMGGWVARSADRALRLYADDPDLYRRIAEAVSETALDPDDPSRMIYPLLLRRRIALHSVRFHDVDTSRRVAEEFITVARTAAFPSRWRRFATWLLAEFWHTRHRDGTRLIDSNDLERAIRATSRDRVTGDVVRVLRAKPGFRAWELPGGDLYRYETRRPDGGFHWAHDPETSRWIDAGLRPLVAQRRARLWMDAPDRLMLRTHDSMSELVSHPGLVRVQSAVDMLVAAGPAVGRPASETFTRMLKSPNAWTAMNPGVVDNVLYALGALRQRPDSRRGDNAAYWLAANANRIRSPELRASAIWSLGDTWSTVPERNEQVVGVVASALADDCDTVRRAAIRAASALRDERLADAVTLLSQDQRVGERTRQLAVWCLETLDDRSIAQPPSEVVR